MILHTEEAKVPAKTADKVAAPPADDKTPADGKQDKPGDIATKPGDIATKPGDIATKPGEDGAAPAKTGQIIHTTTIPGNTDWGYISIQVGFAVAAVVLIYYIYRVFTRAPEAK